MGMANRYIAVAPALGLLALLAPPALATFLTLSSVELIATEAAPISCVMAYNTPIFGCQVQDFMQDNECSELCVRALQQVQRHIQGSCQGVDAPPESLIYHAQQGDLVNVLCDQPAAQSSTIPSARPFITIHPGAPVSETTSESAEVSLTSSSSETSSVETAVRTTATVPKPASSTSITMERSKTRSPTSESTTHSVKSSQAITSTVKLSSTRSSKPETIETGSGEQTKKPQAGGGGDPFDVPQPAGSARVAVSILALAFVFMMAI